MLNVLFVLVLVSITAPLAYYKLSGNKSGKTCLTLNIVTFFGLLLAGSIYCIGGAVPALAAGEAAGLTVGEGLKYIGAALATGLSGIGGGIAVAQAASAAIGAMSENESIMGKTLIFVALAEGIALYGLVISIMILNG
ncbi:MAG: ATP synthase subunit C [Clostridia bacterium]|nr:ATP synthase subunit C [Clostridia bacterium]